MVPWKHFLLACLFAAYAAALAGCNRKSDADAPAELSADQRASIGSLIRKLDEASNRLQILEDKASRAGSRMRQELRDEIADLEKKSDRLYGKLQELHSDGSEGWVGLKDDAARGVDSLGRAVIRTWNNVAAEERTAEADGEPKDP